MRFPGSCIGLRSSISGDHLSGRPTAESHEIVVASASRLYRVGERMTELVRMYVPEAGLLPTALNHLIHP
jgi:hypothetical protein